MVYVRPILSGEDIMEWVIRLVLIAGWIAGIVIAKGYVSTLAAVLVVPYAWYLVIEKIMITNGWL